MTLSHDAGPPAGFGHDATAPETPMAPIAPTAPVTPVTPVTLGHDAAGALIADLTRRMEELRAATYTGRDPGGLAEATIDGDGLVVEVKLARTVARYRPEVVAEAIRVALDAAAAEVAEAYGNLAQRAEAWEAEQ